MNPVDAVQAVDFFKDLAEDSRLFGRRGSWPLGRTIRARRSGDRMGSNGPQLGFQDGERLLVIFFVAGGGFFLLGYLPDKAEVLLQQVQT